MFDFVLKILDKSANDCVDIGVACDKCVSDDNEHEKEFRNAFLFIKSHYEAITKCRRMNDNNTIYTMCWLFEGKFENALVALMIAIAERE